ncbi:hypothetical protein MBOT_01080 [Mycobacterium botniense]|uniref:Uncharacterized protein n=1 Tax=Mycobacterium botniense TaxID=84962 RepID=A0A7I9XRX0_9MYCO|nr:hypothetical protein MBOT_01080 [Mycobacterium botniense]
MRFIGGVQLGAQPAEAVVTLPRSHWQATISADASEVRDTGAVAEITDLVSVTGWPTGTTPSRVNRLNHMQHASSTDLHDTQPERQCPHNHLQDLPQNPG